MNDKKSKKNEGLTKSHEFSSLRRGIKDANGIVRTITVLTVLNPETGLYRVLIEGLPNFDDESLKKIHCRKGKCFRDYDTLIVSESFTGGEKNSIEEMDDVVINWIKVYKNFITNAKQSENQIPIPFNGKIQEGNRHPEAGC